MSTNFQLKIEYLKLVTQSAVGSTYARSSINLGHIIFSDV